MIYLEKNKYALENKKLQKDELNEKTTESISGGKKAPFFKKAAQSWIKLMHIPKNTDKQ